MDLSDEIYELKLDNHELLIDLYQCFQFKSVWDKNVRLIHAPHIRTSKKTQPIFFLHSIIFEILGISWL